MIWLKFVFTDKSIRSPWWSHKKRILTLTHQRKQINFNALQLDRRKKRGKSATAEWSEAYSWSIKLT